MPDLLKDKLRDSVQKLVAQFFPQLVAIELQKLAGGAESRRVGVREQILALHAEGKRNCDIARELGTAQSYVSRIISESKAPSKGKKP